MLNRHSDVSNSVYGILICEREHLEMGRLMANKSCLTAARDTNSDRRMPKDGMISDH